MGLARFLPKFGWEPVILAPHDAARERYPFDVIETGDRPLFGSLKRGLGGTPDAALKDLLAASPAAASPFGRAMAAGIDLAKALLAIPDQRRGWLAPAERAAQRAILARRRCRPRPRRRRPRDRPAVHRARPRPPPRRHARRAVGRRLPRPLGRQPQLDCPRLALPPRPSDRAPHPARCARAGHRLVASRPAARRGLPVPPGGQRSSMASTPTILPRSTHSTRTASSPRFTITHTGTFYQGRRDPSMFLATLAGLFADGRVDRRRVQVRFFSRHEDWVLAPVRELGLEDVVRILPWAPQAEDDLGPARVARPPSAALGRRCQRGSTPKISSILRRVVRYRRRRGPRRARRAFLPKPARESKCPRPRPRRTTHPLVA